MVLKTLSVCANILAPSMTQMGTGNASKGKTAGITARGFRASMDAAAGWFLINIRRCFSQERRERPKDARLTLNGCKMRTWWAAWEGSRMTSRGC